MSLWPILTVLTLLALALVLLPLVRRPGPVAARREHDLGVYRAQLKELERDQERGLLGPEEARAARLEVERRMLAADVAERALPSGSAGRRRWLTAAVLLLALPTLSAVLYGRLGRPDLPALPFAERPAGGPQAAAAGAGAGDAASLPSVEQMITDLERQVAATPADLEGWRRLARAYQLVGQPSKAVDAYQHALALDEASAELQAGFAEAAIEAAGGIVTEKAGKALTRALELEPADPRARFYQGLALVQRGERQQALDLWAGLIKDTPADAPYLGVLRDRVTALAQDLGQDPAKVMPAPAPPAMAATAPPATVRAAEPADQLPTDPAALQAEAARLDAALAQAPKDWQGWIRLARARAALGQPADAAAALAGGAKVYAAAPFVQQQFRAVAGELGVAAPGSDGGAEAPVRGPSAEQMQAAQQMAPEEQTQMIRGMVEGLAARLADQPDDVEGWRMLARSYGVLGDHAKAVEAAAEVAKRLPADPTAQLDYAEALLALERDDTPLSAAAIDQLQKVAALDADNPEALFFLGRAAAEQGDPDRARASWQRLLAKMPPDAPQRAELQKLIDQLGASD